MQNTIKKIYKDIYNSIVELVPEKWDRIYLYARVVQNLKGEMYFYYFPKKLIKTNPINCYEVPSKFGIDDNTYNKALTELYDKIKYLKQFLRVNWTNITIIIDKKMFTIEYHYDDLVNSRYTDNERHIIWCYKNLKTPIDSLSKKEQNLINNYKEESKFNPTIFVEEIEKLEKIDIKNPILKIKD